MIHTAGLLFETIHHPACVIILYVFLLGSPAAV